MPCFKRPHQILRTATSKQTKNIKQNQPQNPKPTKQPNQQKTITKSPLVPMKYSSSDVFLENFHLRWFSVLHQDSSSSHDTNLLWVGHRALLLACEDKLPVTLSEAGLALPHFRLKQLEKLRMPTPPPPKSQAAQMLTADLRQPMDSTQHSEILCSKSVHCRNSGLLTLALDEKPPPPPHVFSLVLQKYVLQLFGNVQC